MRTWTALLVLTAATMVGIVMTLLAGQEPGFLLAFFIIVGLLIATLGVRRGVVYLFFPLPALAFFLAALATGAVHDSRLTSSTAGLTGGFLQWVAGIFVPMVVATILVVLIGGGRWLLGRQLVTGQFSPSAARLASPGNARSDPGTRRTAGGGSWADENPFDDPQQGRAPSLDRDGARDGARGGRPARDQRTDRDPWGDPRLPADPRPPADRSQPPSPRPRAAGPASQPQPPARAPRPTWAPASRPPRPPRPPRDPRDQP